MERDIINYIFKDKINFIEINKLMEYKNFNYYNNYYEYYDFFEDRSFNVLDDIYKTKKKNLYFLKISNKKYYFLGKEPDVNKKLLNSCKNEIEWDINSINNIYLKFRNLFKENDLETFKKQIENEKDNLRIHNKLLTSSFIKSKNILLKNIDRKYFNNFYLQKYIKKVNKKNWTIPFEIFNLNFNLPCFYKIINSINLNPSLKEIIQYPWLLIDVFNRNEITSIKFRKKIIISFLKFMEIFTLEQISQWLGNISKEKVRQIILKFNFKKYFLNFKIDDIVQKFNSKFILNIYGEEKYNNYFYINKLKIVNIKNKFRIASQWEGPDFLVKDIYIKNKYNLFLPINLEVNKKNRDLFIEAYWKKILEKFKIYSLVKIEILYSEYLSSDWAKYSKERYQLRAFHNRIEHHPLISFNNNIRDSNKIILPFINKKNKLLICNEIEKILINSFKEYKFKIVSYEKIINDKVKYKFILGETLFNDYFDSKNQYVVDNLSQITFSFWRKEFEKNSKFTTFRYPILMEKQTKQKNKIKESHDIAMLVITSDNNYKNGFFKTDIYNNLKMTTDIGIASHWWSQNIDRLKNKDKLIFKKINGEIYCEVKK